MEVLQQTVCKKPDIQGPQEGSSNHTPSAEPLITLWFLWLSSGPSGFESSSNNLPPQWIFCPCTNGWHRETAGSTSAFSTQVPLEQLWLALQLPGSVSSIHNFNGAFCICHIICYTVLLRDTAQHPRCRHIWRIGRPELWRREKCSERESHENLWGHQNYTSADRKRAVSCWPSREQTKTSTTMKSDIISTDSFCFKFGRSPESFLLPNARLLVSIAQKLQKQLCRCELHNLSHSGGKFCKTPNNFCGSFVQIYNIWCMCMYIYIYI